MYNNILRKIKNRIFKYNKKTWIPKNKDLYQGNIYDTTFYTEVIAENNQPFESVSDFCGEKVCFNDFPVKNHGSLGVYLFKGATTYFDSGLIKLKNNKYFITSTWFSDNIDDMKYVSSPKKCQKRQLKGLSLLLTSEFASNNYGHFLLDGLGRLAIFQKYDIALIDKCDWIIVSGPESRWKSKLLNRLQIPSSKTIWASKNDAFHCEQLYAASFPGIKRFYSSWLCEYFSKSIITPDQKTIKNRRLFISRKGTNRNIINEKKIAELAARFNFEPYLPENSDDAIADFINAEAVIGAHGAGLTDILFMQPKAKVLELMPSDHVYSYFYSLALSAKLDYTMIVGNSLQERPKNTWGPSPYDFEVNEKLFLEYLNKNFN
jgi:hypothetical protein